MFYCLWFYNPINKWWSKINNVLVWYLSLILKTKITSSSKGWTWNPSSESVSVTSVQVRQFSFLFFCPNHFGTISACLSHDFHPLWCHYGDRVTVFCVYIIVMWWWCDADLLTSPWMSALCPSGGLWRNCRAVDASLTTPTLWDQERKGHSCMHTHAHTHPKHVWTNYINEAKLETQLILVCSLNVCERERELHCRVDPPAICCPCSCKWDTLTLVLHWSPADLRCSDVWTCRRRRRRRRRSKNDNGREWEDEKKK